MLIGYNVAFFRQASALTQEQLGERLGWTNVAVSAAERSWSGKRVRKFDADEVLALALALSVPLIALFLPPLDDGDPDFYAFAGPKGGLNDMGDLVALAVMPDSEDDEPPMDAYRDRLRAAVTRYMDPQWAEELAGWLRKIDSDEALDDRAERLRARQAELRQAAEELGDLASAIENRRRHSEG